MTVYGQLRGEPPTPLTSLVRVTEVGAKWLGVDKVAAVMVPREKNDQSPRVPMIKRVALESEECLSFCHKYDPVLRAASIDLPRRGAVKPMWDYLLRSNLYCGPPEVSDHSGSVQRPVFQVSVRADISKRTPAEMQSLAEQLAITAATEFEISHGNIELVYGPFSDDGLPYIGGCGGWLDLDRAMDNNLWRRVTDPVHTVNRVGYITLLSDYFVDRIFGGREKCKEAYKNLVDNIPIDHYVMDLANGVTGFVAGEDPMEYLGKDDWDLAQGRHSTNGQSPVLLVCAMLRRRLREANLII
jgi:hypothetical protein